MGVDAAKDKGQENCGTQCEGEKENGDQVVELLAAALVQDVNHGGTINARHNIGKQPKGTVLDRTVRHHPGYDAGENGNEANDRSDEGGYKDGRPELFHDGIEDPGVNKRRGAIPDEHQVRPAFPHDPLVYLPELDKHNNGKEQDFKDQDSHTAGKLFVHEGSRAKRHQKSQRYQDQGPVLDDVIS